MRHSYHFFHFSCPEFQFERKSWTTHTFVSLVSRVSSSSSTRFILGGKEQRAKMEIGKCSLFFHNRSIFSEGIYRFFPLLWSFSLSFFFRCGSKNQCDFIVHLFVSLLMCCFCFFFGESLFLFGGIPKFLLLLLLFLFYFSIFRTFSNQSANEPS